MPAARTPRRPSTCWLTTPRAWSATRRSRPGSSASSSPAAWNRRCWPTLTWVWPTCACASRPAAWCWRAKPWRRRTAPAPRRWRGRWRRTRRWTIAWSSARPARLSGHRGPPGGAADNVEQAVHLGGRAPGRSGARSSADGDGCGERRVGPTSLRGLPPPGAKNCPGGANGGSTRGARGRACRACAARDVRQPILGRALRRTGTTVCARRQPPPHRLPGAGSPRTQPGAARPLRALAAGGAHHTRDVHPPPGRELRQAGRRDRRRTHRGWRSGAGVPRRGRRGAGVLRRSGACPPGRLDRHRGPRRRDHLLAPSRMARALGRTGSEAVPGRPGLPSVVSHGRARAWARRAVRGVCRLDRRIPGAPLRADRASAGGARRHRPGAAPTTHAGPGCCPRGAQRRARSGRVHDCVTSPFGFAALVAETEDTLVQQLGLRPVALEPALAQADGAWKGEPVSLTTRAYSGGAVRYARFARLVGPDLEIGNVLCLPDPLYPLPILGADLVALGRATGMLAADLSPTLPPGPERDHQLASFPSLGLARSSLPPGGALPGWCQAWFSPHALFTRVPLERADEARRAFAVFPRVFTRLARQATPRPDQAAAVRAAQAGYAAAHRADDKGLGLLARMFGAAWADRYVGEALFPSQA